MKKESKLYTRKISQTKVGSVGGNKEQKRYMMQRRQIAHSISKSSITGNHLEYKQSKLTLLKDIDWQNE